MLMKEIQLAHTNMSYPANGSTLVSIHLITKSQQFSYNNKRLHGEPLCTVLIRSILHGTNIIKVTWNLVVLIRLSFADEKSPNTAIKPSTIIIATCY